MLAAPEPEVRLGPRGQYPTQQQLDEAAESILQAARLRLEVKMHYRNGREAKNGDKIVQLGTIYSPDGKAQTLAITTLGILYDAKPGNDYCNGNIAPIQPSVAGACMCDCLHVDDVAAFLTEKGLDKRPAGK